MMRFNEMCGRLALAAALVGLAPGAAHAGYPGENGVIVYRDQATGTIMKVAGSGTGTPISLGAKGFTPVVSPNGKKVAYFNYDNENELAHVFVMNIDGSNVVDVGLGAAPSWSPDGKKLAFFVISGVAPGLYTANTSGWQRTLWFAASNLPAMGPRLSWSPLGDRIAFDQDGQTYIFDVNSHSTIVVAPGSSSQTRVEPSWYPDGLSLVVDDISSGCAYQVKADLTVSSLSTCGNFARWPSVSPDGSSLLAGGSPYLWTRPIASTGGGQFIASGGETGDWSRVPKTVMATSLASGQWSTPGALANDTDFYASDSALVVMPPDGEAASQTTMQVVAIGPDGRIYHRARKTNGFWTPFAVVPGVGGSSDGVRAKRLAIAASVDGSSQVVIVGSDDLVYHAARYANGQWSGFAPLEGYNQAPNFAARDVAIVISPPYANPPNAATVVANALADGTVYVTVRVASGAWWPFIAVAGGASNTSRLAMALSNNQDVYLLATTPQGVIRQKRNNLYYWDQWITMYNSAGFSNVSLAASNGLGGVLARVTYVDSLGKTWYEERPNAELLSGWTGPVSRQLLMSNGRSVSIANTATGGAVVTAVQTQPQ